MRRVRVQKKKKKASGMLFVWTGLYKQSVTSLCVCPSFWVLVTCGPMTWKVSSAWMHVISRGSVPETWHSSLQVWKHTDAETCRSATVTEVRLHLGWGLCCSPPPAAPCAQWVCGRNQLPPRRFPRSLWPSEPGARRDQSAASAAHWPAPLLPCGADRAAEQEVWAQDIERGKMRV